MGRSSRVTLAHDVRPSLAAAANDLVFQIGSDPANIERHDKDDR